MRRSLNLLASLAIGYVAGAKTGEKNIDELSRSLKALRQTDEFAQVISALAPRSPPCCGQLHRWLRGSRLGPGLQVTSRPGSGTWRPTADVAALAVRHVLADPA
jgi:hypothetical protein